jgi:GPH family glycoside/pentoside/hexuronide:cation symporter
MIVFMILLGKLTAKFGKKNVIVSTMLVGAISGIVSIFAPVTPDMKGMILYIVCLMGLNIGNAVFQISVWAIVADCIEVSYRKTGKSEEGSLYALYSFFRKLSQGIGQAVVSWGLVAIGFVEGENAVQPESFGKDVKNLYFIVLAVGSLIAFLAMKFIYNIGKKNVLVVTMLVGAISGLASLFAPITADGKGMLLYIFCLMGLNVGNAVFQISVWAIVADCIELS